MLRIVKKISVKMLLTVVFLILLVLGFAFRTQIYDQFLHSFAYYHVYLGDKKYKKGKLHEAIKYYNKALQIYPGHIKARYNLGNIYVVYEDYNSAISCYQKALKYNPNFLNARINLGIILSEELKDFDSAIKHYEAAIEAKPLIINIPHLFNNVPFIKSSKATAYYNMALAYSSKSLLFADDPILKRKYLKRAAECYKNSLKIDSKRYETRYNYALTLYLLGNYTESTRQYCKAINLGPLNYDVHYNFALLLRDRKVFDESVSELKKAALILDTSSHSIDTRYIFDVLNEVSQKALIQKRYYHLVDDLNNEPQSIVHLTYVNGRVVVSEELDKAILENMMYCKSCQGIE